MLNSLSQQWAQIYLFTVRAASSLDSIIQRQSNILPLPHHVSNSGHWQHSPWLFSCSFQLSPFYYKSIAKLKEIKMILVWVTTWRRLPWVWSGVNRDLLESHSLVWFAKPLQIISMLGSESIPSAFLAIFHSLVKYCKFVFVSIGWSFLVSPSPAHVTFPEGNDRCVQYACLDGAVEIWHHPGTLFVRGSIPLITRLIAECACFFVRTAGFDPLTHFTIHYLEVIRAIARSYLLVCLIWLSSQSYWPYDLYGPPCLRLISALHSIYPD